MALNVENIDLENSEMGFNPNQTNYSPDEISPLAEAEIEYFLRQRQTPRPIDASYREYFPTPRTPVTQQGFSGYGVSIPTIAPTGALFPMSLVQKRIAEQQERQQMQPPQYIDPEFNQVADLSRNINYQKGVHDWVEKKKQWAIDLSIEKYGTPAYFGSILNNDKEFNDFVNTERDIVPMINQAWETLKKVKEDKTGFYSEEVRNLQQRFPQIMDRLIDIDNKDRLKDMQEVGKIISEMQGHENVNTTIKSWFENTGLDTALTNEEIRKTGDYDRFSRESITGHFLKKDENGLFEFDKNGDVIFDEAKFNQWFDDNYESTYSTEDEWTPEYKKMKNIALNGIKREEKAIKDTVGKYNEWARRRIIREEKDRYVDFSKGKNVLTSVNPLTGSAVNVTMDDYISAESIPDKDRIVDVTADTELINVETGESIILPKGFGLSVLGRGNTNIVTLPNGKTNIVSDSYETDPSYGKKSIEYIGQNIRNESTYLGNVNIPIGEQETITVTHKDKNGNTYSKRMTQDELSQGTYLVKSEAMDKNASSKFSKYNDKYTGKNWGETIDEEESVNLNEFEVK